MYLVAYTQLYHFKSVDLQLAIYECQQRNRNHPGISKLVLFKESYAPPLREASVPLEMVQSNECITYAEWLRLVKHQGSGIGLLPNTDIYMDKGLEHLAVTCDAPLKFLEFTHFNLDHTGFHLNNYRYWTQVVWNERKNSERQKSLVKTSSSPLLVWWDNYKSLNPLTEYHTTQAINRNQNQL